MPDIPAIAEIRNDGGDALWKLEWLGAVEQLAHEARIDVHLCRHPGNANDRRVVKIGAGQLPCLTHGSMWRAGQRVAEHALSTRMQLRDISIEDGCVQLVQLNHDIGTTKDGLKSWLVPPFRYALPKQVYQSYCLAIEHKGDPFGILVPAMEVIRFYYVPSTALAHVMFRGLLQPTSIRKVLNPVISGLLDVDGKRRMVIARSMYMSNNDCVILGRILGDANAFAGAGQIHDSLLKAAANGKSPFARSNFPFRGTVNWTARVVNSSPQPDKPRWLILEIERCNGALPFDELAVAPDNDNQKANPETDLPDNEKKIAFPRRPSSAALDPNGELQSDAAPAADVKPILFDNPSSRFDALAGKHIIKITKKECPYKAGQLKSPFAPLGQDMGTGEGTYGETAIKPAEIVLDMHDEEKERTRRKALEASFAVLYEVVDEINKIENASAHVRNSKAVATIPIPEPSKRRQWAWLSSSERKRREVMVVDVIAGERSGCVVEFSKRISKNGKESRAMGVLVCQGNGILSDGDLAYLLFALAEEQGVWKKVSACPTDVAIKSLNHTKPTAVDLAQAIVQVITHS
jgi:hypothetical protein